MKTRYKLLFTSIFLIYTGITNADVVVLVHGFLSNAGTWHQNGITQQLEHAGWPVAGYYGRYGAQHYPTPRSSQHRVILVDLPHKAPIPIQANWLSGYLQQIASRYPNEALIIVGHSAGGIVARASLVQHHPIPIRALISIASPHLGTPQAEQGLRKTDDSLAFRLIKTITVGKLYSTARDSRSLLVNLLPPTQGSFLYWLNQQQHPAIDYFAIVRSADKIVPPVSQNMKNIPALRSYSRVHLTPPGHFLRPSDGRILVTLLQSLTKTP
jgi:pimeloyl-ACP methyl ester carboxylesterase